MEEKPTYEPLFPMPYARLREETNQLLANARSARDNGMTHDGAVLQAIQARLLVDIADSLDRIADNLNLLASRP